MQRWRWARSISGRGGENNNRGATNYPRFFDLADTGDQAQQLAFTPSNADVGTLTPDDFAQVNLLVAK